ncbi:DUF3077 domain-containing protein [Solimonas soli]|uniref:DUF3077 domain-containing protein n=1 Tax=Solimonas soli TaxID=413479 RepID=UPI0004B6D086|nr:DUF3077 domain-containing protein [Solimonas soli]
MKQAEKDGNAPATAAHSFVQYAPGKIGLFSVPAGISAEIALEHASCFIDCAETLSRIVATEIDDNAAESNMAHAAKYLNEMGKALIDAVSSGLLHKNIVGA